MNRTSSYLIGASLLAAVSAPVSAQNDALTAVTQTYVEAYALRYSHDLSGAGAALSRDISGDGDGYSVGGSLDIPNFGEVQNFSLVGRYSSASDDADNDYTAYRAGLGYFFTPKDEPARFQFFAHLQYESQEFGDGGPGLEDDGYSITGGAHFYIDDRILIGVGAGWVDLGDPQGFRTTISGYYELPWQIYIGGEWENQSLSQDFDTQANDSADERYRQLRFGLRKTF